MLFTVIVPIYKVEAYLRGCLDSILAQTYTDFEIVLVDDGSPDHCPAICDEYAGKDNRIRVIHKPNGGLGAARNTGVFAARGDYICFVDGDDLVNPEMLAFVHDRLASSPVPLDMVIFAAERVSREGRWPFLNKVPEGYYDPDRLKKEIFPILLSDRRHGFQSGTALQSYTWNKVTRRELHLEHYLRDEEIRVMQDVPLTTEILLNCKNIYICNKILYYYNMTNPNSISTISNYNYLTLSFRHLVMYLRERLKGYGADMNRQLNDYPVLLIRRTAVRRLMALPFREAVRSVREGLDLSGMLEFVSLKGLPFKPALFMLLFKLHMDRTAMALCLMRMRRSKK